MLLTIIEIYTYLLHCAYGTHITQVYAQKKHIKRPYINLCIVWIKHRVDKLSVYKMTVPLFSIPLFWKYKTQ